MRTVTSVRAPRRALTIHRIATSGGLALSLAASACTPEPGPEPTGAAPVADTAATATHYARELFFVGERAAAPLVVSFAFTAVEEGEEHRRSARAWLAHAGEWDAFLDESWTTPAAAGVWRIVPHGDLRVIADGPAEFDALLYRRGERTLRLAPRQTVSTLALRESLQYRLHRGRLELGGQPIPGFVLETFEVRDGTARTLDFAGAADWFFTTDGGALHLLVSEAMGAPTDPERTFAWAVLPDGEQSRERAEIRWVRMQPIEAARRDVPVHWSFRIPEIGVEGELESIAFDLELGPDRPGRRSVQLRHTVDGWAAVGGERQRIYGVLRHSQE